MIFELRQYDEILLTFEFNTKPLVGQYCKIIDVVEDKKHLLPIGLSVTDEGIFSWLKTRIVPKNRDYMDTILAKYGLSHNDTLGVIKLCMGLSLNDSYWVVEKGFVGKFVGYNLFTRHSSYNLKADRLKKIEDYLQVRIGELLKM